MKKTLLTTALIAGFALAGCGGGATSTPGAAPSSAQSAGSSAAPSSAASADAGMTVNATLMDFEIELAEADLTAPFSVAVVNNGPTPHDFSIKDASGTKLFTSGELTRGKTGSVAVPELAPGEYTYYCSLPGHESLGMHGTLTVAD